MDKQGDALCILSILKLIQNGIPNTSTQHITRERDRVQKRRCAMEESKKSYLAKRSIDIVPLRQSGVAPANGVSPKKQQPLATRIEAVAGERPRPRWPTYNRLQARNHGGEGGRSQFSGANSVRAGASIQNASALFRVSLRACSSSFENSCRTFRRVLARPGCQTTLSVARTPDKDHPDPRRRMGLPRLRNSSPVHSWLVLRETWEDSQAWKPFVPPPGSADTRCGGLRSLYARPPGLTYRAHTRPPLYGNIEASYSPLLSHCAPSRESSFCGRGANLACNVTLAWPHCRLLCT